MRRLLQPEGDRLLCGWRGAVVVGVVWAVACVPGLMRLPPVDRDESRFAQASRQMFEALAWGQGRLDLRELAAVDRGEGQTPEARGGMHAGGAVVPMVQERARLNKPPLIYWLQVASAWVLSGGEPGRDAIWMYRVPSVLAALAAGLVAWRLGAGMALAGPVGAWPGLTGVLAGAMLVACPLVQWEARQARADMVLLAWTSVAMLGLWGAWRGAAEGKGRRWGAVGLVLAGTVLGGLTKGPITPMVVALTALGASVLAGRWRWLTRSGVGLALVGCVAALGAWAWAVSEQVGWGVYRAVVVDEVLGRSASAKEGHWGPPGYHLVLVTALFFPGSLYTLAAGVRAWRERRSDAAGLFLLAWVVPSWVVFEAVSTKLPHYPLPLYPALAVLTARFVVGVGAGAVPRAALGAFRVGAVVWFLVGCGVIAVPLAGLGVISAMHDDRWSVAHSVGALAGVAAVVALGAALARAFSQRVVGAVVLGLAAAVSAGVGSIACMVPHTRGVHVSERLMEVVRAEGVEGRAIASAVYHEDSLVFLTRGRLEKINEAEMEGWVRANPGGVLIAPEDDETGTNTGPPAWLRGLRFLGRVRGLNYAGGRRETLLMWAGPEECAADKGRANE